MSLCSQSNYYLVATRISLSFFSFLLISASQVGVSLQVSPRQLCSTLTNILSLKLNYYITAHITKTITLLRYNIKNFLLIVM